MQKWIKQTPNNKRKISEQKTTKETVFCVHKKHLIGWKSFVFGFGAFLNSKSFRKKKKKKKLAWNSLDSLIYYTTGFSLTLCTRLPEGIDDWGFTLFEKCETHKQVKERETFWQHKLKTFYPHGLNEKEEYLF